MRLIDADELIERIGKWISKDPCGREQTVEERIATDIAVSVYMEIEEAPTAFDKEKVIKEIKEKYEHAAHWEVIQGICEIVEKGGIE